MDINLPGQETSAKEAMEWNKTVAKWQKDNKSKYDPFIKSFMQATKKQIESGIPGRILLCRGIDEVNRYKLPIKRIDIACDEPRPEPDPLPGCRYLIKKDTDLFGVWFNANINKQICSALIGWETYMENIIDKKITTVILPLSIDDILQSIAYILETNISRGGQLPNIVIGVSYNNKDSVNSKMFTLMFKQYNYVVDTMNTNIIIPQFTSPMLIRREVRCDMYCLKKIKQK